MALEVEDSYEKGMPSVSDQQVHGENRVRVRAGEFRWTRQQGCREPWCCAKASSHVLCLRQVVRVSPCHRVSVTQQNCAVVEERHPEGGMRQGCLARRHLIRDEWEPGSPACGDGQAEHRAAVMGLWKYGRAKCWIFYESWSWWGKQILKALSY